MKHTHSIKEEGETVREFAQRINCTLAFNASTMCNVNNGVKPHRVQIIDGNIIQNIKTTTYTLGIKENNLLVAYKSEVNIDDILKDEVNNALTAFGPCDRRLPYCF